MLKKLLLLTLVLCSLNLFAQNKSNVELLPSGLHFLPLKGNFQEARIGIQYYPENAALKVDIGNDIDLLAIHFPESKAKLTFGVEFMAYALSNSFEGKRLQIDALDGFFGGNAVFSKKYSEFIFISRFRFIHNSAHLVDGSFIKTKNMWKNNVLPIPYTKDFGEFTFALQHDFEKYFLQYNLGFSYATHVRPDELKEFEAAAGFEFAVKNPFGKFLGKETNLFVTDFISFEGNPKYVGNNNLMGGIKFGEWYSKGVVFYVSYYTGRNMFSEYYYERVSKFGIGFFIDFI